MQTQLADFIKNTDAGREADSILRSCVHCGFCTATCPTYQLLGDELDGPRGRIYQIKDVLEGKPATATVQSHLDRCLTCRACETTCPSGVDYHHLLDIGREVVGQQVTRPPLQRAIRKALRLVLPYSNRFTPLLRIGQIFRAVLPPVLKGAVPQRMPDSARPTNQHARTMLLLEGCVQPGIAPNINSASARVLEKLGISLVAAPQAGCCGAVSFHLDAQEEGRNFMRRVIDAWWPLLESGAEAIVMTASGCGAMVKDYGHALKADPAYADKAAKVSALCKDIGEILAEEDLSKLKINTASKLAFHSPCTLQHGQKLNGKVESVLQEIGFTLTPVKDAHLCCGSAGTYSLLQPEISQQLRDNKLAALEAGNPDLVATANIGCLTQLQGRCSKPVKHWIEIVDEVIQV